MRRKKLIFDIMASLLMAVTLCSCNTVDDDRLPSMPVVINLSTPDLWSTYGVAGYGEYRIFIRSLGEPRNFPYVSNSATGYGGVLLISGFNPYTLEAAVPLAYDLACPVERDPNVRVRMQTGDALPFAVCPECGSHYDVTEAGGTATEGPAKQRKLGMTRYECYQTSYGGYMIGN